MGRALRRPGEEGDPGDADGGRQQGRRRRLPPRHRLHGVRPPARAARPGHAQDPGGVGLARVQLGDHGRVPRDQPPLLRPLPLRAGVDGASAAHCSVCWGPRRPRLHLRPARPHHTRALRQGCAARGVAAVVVEGGSRDGVRLCGALQQHPEGGRGPDPPPQLRHPPHRRQLRREEAGCVPLCDAAVRDHRGRVHGGGADGEHDGQGHQCAATQAGARQARITRGRGRRRFEG
mmetsp:Transcript_20865/g.42343  ORF Transcript_20865/g.42343 Transcript_20865/m.42343 type:complete len:233 (-) Transcript_20865:154-852(-)